MKKIIYLDPGHGDLGGDFGAVGKDGTREADINLAIAKAAKNELTLRGYKVRMSRNSETTSFPIYSDALGDLPFRAEEANKSEANLFISVHCNANPNPSASGTEVFYASGSVLGKIAAKCILNEVLYLQQLKKSKYKTNVHMFNLWNFSGRGVSTENYHVLTHTDMAAVLCETLFLSNPEDLELLKTKEFQKLYGLAIAQGVDKFFAQQSLVFKGDSPGNYDR